MSDDIDTGKNQTTISTSDSNAMKQLFAAGIPVDEISKKLNLTKTMVTKTLKLDLCKKIEFLLSEGYPIRQISKMVGVCSPTISYWINSGENQALYIYAKPKSTINKETLTKSVISDHLKRIPRKTIERSYCIHYNTVKRILEEAGFNLLSNDKMKKLYYHADGQFNRPISDDLYNYLTGSLLGDGHIGITTQSQKVPDYNYDLHDYQNALTFLSELKTISFTENNTNFTEVINQFNTAIKIITDMPTSKFSLLKSVLESHWVEHNNTLFADSGYKTRVYERTSIRQSGFTGNTIKVFSIALDSCASVQLELIRKKWYDKNGKKHIPSNLKLRSDSLLYWYIDDGGLSTRNEIILYTNAFSKSENLLLARKIYKAVGSTFYIREKITNGKVYPVLVCVKRYDVQLFFDYLEESKKKTLALAKREFPWKFDSSIKKFEYLHSIKDSNAILEKYLSTKDGKKNKNKIF